MPNLSFDLTKPPLSIDNVKTLLILASQSFWHLAKNLSNNFTSSAFPPLLLPGGTTAVSSVSKAKLFSQTFSKKSTLEDSEHIPPDPPPSDYYTLFLLLISSIMMFSMASLVATLRRFMVLMECLLSFLKSVLLC